MADNNRTAPADTAGVCCGEEQVMSEDLIKRSDAIDLLWYFQDECCSAVVGDFEKLPSADRPQGESILQDTIQRLERVIKHGVVGKDGMHPVSAEVVLNWLKGAGDEDN